jgi:hypothetical protein
MAKSIDEKSDHAFRAAETGVVGRHAQARYSSEKLIGVDICAHLAGGDRRTEQCAEGRPESPVEVTWQIVERRIARMQSLGKPALSSHKLCVSLHPVRQSVERRIRLRKYRRDVGAGVNFTAEDGGDQIGALRKMPVEGAKANAGLIRDLPHRRIDARGCKDLFGRKKQSVEAALSVGAHPTLRSARRFRTDIMIFWSVDHHFSLAKRNNDPY